MKVYKVRHKKTGNFMHKKNWYLDDVVSQSKTKKGGRMWSNPSHIKTMLSNMRDFDLGGINWDEWEVVEFEVSEIATTPLFDYAPDRREGKQDG